MRNELFNQMLSAYDLTTEQQKLNATFEVNQQIILAGLYNGGFFDEAAFYGGTCLRIFHGLQRFSEDMDFSLLAPNDKFDFTNFFQPIIDQFAMVGRNIEIKKKDKKNVYDITFQTEKSVKIKIEVDTQPPLKFNTEQSVSLCLTSLPEKCMLSFIEHGKIASKEETGMTSNGIYATTSPLISPICKKGPCSSIMKKSQRSLFWRN